MPVLGRHTVQYPLGDPPSTENSIATVPHQVGTTDAEEQSQVDNTCCDVELHREIGETKTGQTGYRGPVRGSLMLDPVQACSETCYGRVALFEKGLVLLFFFILSHSHVRSNLFSPFYSVFIERIDWNGESCIERRIQLNWFQLCLE